MMRKHKKLILILLVSAVLGFTMSILKHSGKWLILKEGFKSIPFYLYIVFILLFVFLTILIHELGHFFSFLFSGIKIRALYVLVFILRKTNNDKWRLEIHPKNIKLFGGLVVPDLGIIDSEHKYETVRSKFAKALIMGPIVSIVFLVTVVLSFLFVWLFTTQYFLIGFLGLMSIVVLIFTILIILSSKVHTDELYGDFVAYDKFKSDEVFVLAQIIQYLGFSSKNQELSDKFLFDKIEMYYLDNTPKYNIFDYNVIANYINMFIRNDVSSKILEKIVTYYSLSSLSTSKFGLELAYLIAAYYYKIENVEKAYESFYSISNINNRYLDKLKQDFLNKQYEHMLNIKNNDEFLNLNKERLLEEYSLLSPIIDVNELMDDIVFKLPFVSYYCEFKEEEE